MVMVRESGAAPVVVLNKADLCTDPALLTAQVLAIAPGTDVLAVSALTRVGAGRLAPVPPAAPKPMSSWDHPESANRR